MLFVSSASELSQLRKADYHADRESPIHLSKSEEFPQGPVIATGLKVGVRLEVLRRVPGPSTSEPLVQREHGAVT